MFCEDLPPRYLVMIDWRGGGQPVSLSLFEFDLFAFCQETCELRAFGSYSRCFGSIRVEGSLYPFLALGCSVAAIGSLPIHGVYRLPTCLHGISS